MKLISFDPLRTLAMPGVRVVKPEHWLKEREALQDADWVLFPEYWQVNALHYGLKARIFPSLASYHLGHDKVEMTRAFESRWPAHVPPTVIEAPTPAGQLAALEALGLPLVVKAVRSSQGRGVHLIHSEGALARWCETQPVLYAQLPLPIDRDLRIVVLGQRIVASYWRIAREGSFLNNVAAGGRLEFSPPPIAAVRLVRAVARGLGINHGGFDVAMVGDHPFLFEFNRLFGLDGLQALGLRMDELIYAHLTRLQTPPKPRPLAPKGRGAALRRRRRAA
ncbi:MAG: hypothetical protein EBU29_10825 [Gammaproteobacteria bacterium]|nr:hypothetical protein [Gammaproteobacteria bacterium]